MVAEEPEGVRSESGRLFRRGVEVRLDYQDPDGIGRTAQTEVARWEAAHLYVWAPLDPRGAPVDIPAGSELILWVHHRPHTYAAGCRAVAVHADSHSPPLLETTLPRRLQRDNQRRFYRVTTDYPADTSLGPATVIDLSGGGCSLFRPPPPSGRPAPALPAAGTALSISFAVPDSTDVFSLGGRVVRSWEVPGGQRLAVAFAEVDRREQDRLVRYVFRRQQQLLRRVRGDRGARS